MEQAHLRWNERGEVAETMSELERYSAGADLPDLARLSQLFGQHHTAAGLVAAWCNNFADALRHDPLGLIPFRHHYTRGFASLQLASKGGAALSLAMYEELPQETAPLSVTFSDRHLCENVLAGQAHAVIHRLAGARGNHALIESESIALTPGSRLELDGLTGARHIGQVKGHLLVLQLTRAPRNPAPSREYRLATSELLMQSSGDKSDSQLELAMAVLEAMGRSDAAAPMAALGCSTKPEHLRWEAIRHALALDTEQGVDALAHLAASGSDPLAEQAGSLLDELQRRYPVLKTLEDTRCLA